MSLSTDSVKTTSADTAIYFDDGDTVKSSQSKLVRFCKQVQVFILSPRHDLGKSQYLLKRSTTKRVKFYLLITNISIPGRNDISNVSELWYNRETVIKIC